MENTVSCTHATPTANNYRTLFLIEGFYPYPFTDLYLNNSCCIPVTIPIAAVSTVLIVVTTPCITKPGDQIMSPFSPTWEVVTNPHA